MYSQCPDCLTRFRVTADVLRAAHGTCVAAAAAARSTRCERLATSDCRRAAPDDAATGTAAWSPPMRPQPRGRAAIGARNITSPRDDLEQVFVDASDWHERSAAPAGPRPRRGEPTGRATRPTGVVVDEGAPVEDITLEGERIEIDGTPQPDEPARRARPRLHRSRLEILLHVAATRPTRRMTRTAQAERELESLAQRAAIRQARLPRRGFAVVRGSRAATGAWRSNPSRSPRPPAAKPVPLGEQRWRRPAERGRARHRSATQARRWARLRGPSAASLLAVVLAAQVMHHYRAGPRARIRRSARRCARPTAARPRRCCRTGISPRSSCASGATTRRHRGPHGACARACQPRRLRPAAPAPAARTRGSLRRHGRARATSSRPSTSRIPSQATRLLAPGASSEAELRARRPRPGRGRLPARRLPARVGRRCCAAPRGPG